ncbi:MAG: hypothetical protein ACI9JK_000522 [Phycisphaerales bacterium]
MQDRILISTRKGLFEYKRDSEELLFSALHFEGDNCTLSFADPRDGCLYVALDHGHFGVKLHRSDNGGELWKEIAVPTYPVKPSDYVDAMQPAMGPPSEWLLQLIWSLVAAHTDEVGTLWCGTLPGGLFYSPDKGESWELNRPLWDDPKRGEWFGGGMMIPGLHSICVDPLDCNHIVLGISCGGIWHTHDGGASWANACKGMTADFMPKERQQDENIQDPHYLVQCKSNPNRMWVQHHNGIFRSDDAGLTWHEIKEAGPSTFGFAVAAHPSKPDTAWFVPGINDEMRIPVDGKFVVTRTDDAGASFKVQSEGLPYPAYDLVLRHAMDVDDTGEFLVMGSTTGGLFDSCNGGKNWNCVTSHLPQIYSVQIG